MKKQILLLIAIAITTISFAQKKTSVGIKAGISQSGLRGDAMNNLQDLIDFADEYISTTNRTGFFAGANVSVPLTNSISIEPGLYYSQKGYALKGELNIKGIEFLGANAKASLNTQYIDLPVLVKANIGGLQFFGGPQLSYLAKADLRTTAGALGFNLYDNKFDATDELNKWDAGLVGGIGYQLSNGMNISASYEHGLSKLDANKRFESYNRSFKIGVGFRF
jgi:hypothetical protein